MKRTLLMVLLLLTGGAIINVAVAWGCAFRLPSAQTQVVAMPVRVDNSTWICGVNRLAAWGCVQHELLFAARPMTQADREASSITYKAGYLANSATGNRSRLDTEKVLQIQRTPWSQLGLRSEFDHQGVIEGEMGAGWPELALWGNMNETAQLFGEKKDHRSSVFEIGVCWLSATGLFGRVDRLPARPIWPGFAINTIFYGAILWLLFAAPGFVRRRIRARRGQCPACAYPVGSSNVCTECGAVLPLPQGEGRGEGEARDSKDAQRS